MPPRGKKAKKGDKDKVPLPAAGERSAQQSVKAVGKYGYRGVFENGNNYKAHISHGGKKEELGTYDTVVAAAVAYNKRAEELKKPLNKISPEALANDQGKKLETKGPAPKTRQGPFLTVESAGDARRKFYGTILAVGGGVRLGSGRASVTAALCTNLLAAIPNPSMVASNAVAGALVVQDCRSLFRLPQEQREAAKTLMERLDVVLKKLSSLARRDKKVWEMVVGC